MTMDHDSRVSLIDILYTFLREINSYNINKQASSVQSNFEIYARLQFIVSNKGQRETC